ncbi:hypothetical protein PTI98_009018 [Pleurotus ostreatus]|nr:hypothetical protein PTI98_009018 [Pleurotus ostreatus]
MNVLHSWEMTERLVVDAIKFATSDVTQRGFCLPFLSTSLELVRGRGKGLSLGVLRSLPQDGELEAPLKEIDFPLKGSVLWTKDELLALTGLSCVICLENRVS